MLKSVPTALAICSTFLAGQAFASDTLRGEPNFISPLGPHMLVAGDDSGMMWARNKDNASPWRKIGLAGDQLYALNKIRCADDNSSTCVVQFTTGTTRNIALVVVGDKYIPPIALKGDGQATWSVEAMTDGQHFYFSTPGAGHAGRDLFLYTTFDDAYARVDRITPVGTLAPDEDLLIADIDQKRTPLAQRHDGTFRILGQLNTVPSFHWSLSDSAVVSSWGILDTEAWAEDQPTSEKARTVRLVTFSRTAGAMPGADATIAARGVVIVTSPVSGEIVAPLSVAIDGLNDVMALTVGPQSRSLSLLCRARTGQYIFKPLVALHGTATPTITASRAGAGFVISTPSLEGSSRIEAIAPSQETYGWARRSCETTDFKRIDAGVEAVANTDSFTARHLSTKSTDDTVVSYDLVTPKGEKPDNAIITVYGAYGVQRPQAFVRSRTAAFLVKNKTASVFPIVRGDGNFGLAFAEASRTPNRQKAVDDVIAVASDLIKQYPGLKGKIVVKGASAGAWLAVKSALTRPDLFSGVIATAGPYLLKDAPYSEGEARFFGAEDDLSDEIPGFKTACPHLHFRFIHAKDDPVVDYAQAKKFAGLVAAAGCPVEFVSHDTGGHLVQIPLGDSKAYDAALRVNFAPF